MNKTVNIKPNQTALDIAIQEYGSVEAVMDLCIANDIAISQILIVDDVLQVPTSVEEDITIKKYYETNKIIPGTAIKTVNTDEGFILFQQGLFQQGLFQ